VLRSAAPLPPDAARDPHAEEANGSTEDRPCSGNDGHRYRQQRAEEADEELQSRRRPLRGTTKDSVVQAPELLADAHGATIVPGPRHRVALTRCGLTPENVEHRDVNGLADAERPAGHRKLGGSLGFIGLLALAVVAED